MQRAGNIVVHRFDQRNEVFEVCKMPSGRVLVVDLARQRCDCGHFQVERLPCHHVIAFYANQHLDWQVYVGDVYKILTHCATRRWLDYPGLTIVANPALRQMSKGRPKLTRYLNEMNSREMRGPRGHSRSRCLQHARPSEVGGSGGS
ncbi:hypothetical protein Ahy_A06g030183 isoform A [Arachis hypogaea]|uniref:SWIM-type domain-containing protein n=1 Tax=Arachis hypogaea TaxID=3818 RepID=A0A445CVH6_ARAHY|nr:hypothetical protein Ahy_A06g030183 isoform A [Arachis hypogaea]